MRFGWVQVFAFVMIATPVASGVVRAGEMPFSLVTVQGCCACARCDSVASCQDGKTPAECETICASDGCRQVNYSISGTCLDGCGSSQGQTSGLTQSERGDGD